MGVGRRLGRSILEKQNVVSLHLRAIRTVTAALEQKWTLHEPVRLKSQAPEWQGPVGGSHVSFCRVTCSGNLQKEALLVFP